MNAEWIVGRRSRDTLSKHAYWQHRHSHPTVSCTSRPMIWASRGAGRSPRFTSYLAPSRLSDERCLSNLCSWRRPWPWEHKLLRLWQRCKLQWLRSITNLQVHICTVQSRKTYHSRLVTYRRLSFESACPRIILTSNSSVSLASACQFWSTKWKSQFGDVNRTLYEASSRRRLNQSRCFATSIPHELMVGKHRAQSLD